MRKAKVVLLVMIMLMLVTGIANATYHVSWFSVQHRVYEDASTRNQFSLTVQDENYAYPTVDVITSVVLTDPNGNVVSISPAFSFYGTIYGRYNSSTGQWEYGDALTFESSYWSTIADNLIPGTYHVVVTDQDNEVSEMDYVFNGAVDLPIIPSESFRYVQDLKGNFWWKWDMPDIDPSLQTSVRVWIDVFDQSDNYLGNLYVTVPTDLGYLFVPRETYYSILSAENIFKLGAHIRTADNNNRAYSNMVQIRKLATRH